MTYTTEQMNEALAAWRSVAHGRGEKDLSEGTLRAFHITRASYCAEWLRGVYGK